MRLSLRNWPSVVAAGAFAALAGCYTADHELIPDADAVTPYAQITFRPDDNEDAAPTALVRSGREYVAHNDDGDITVRFKALDQPDGYVAEMIVHSSDTDIQRLFGVIRVDAGARKAYAYKTVADETQAAPGLRACDKVICIDDLNAYIAAGKSAIATGDPPDVTYDITLE